MEISYPNSPLSDRIPDYLGSKFSPTGEEDKPKFSPTTFCYNPPVSKLAFSPTTFAYDPSASYSLNSLSLDPHKDAMRNTCPDTFTFLSGEEWSDEHRRRVKAALEYYNKKNGTDYEELVHNVTLSNRFLSDGTWFHINFTAKQVVDGKYSHRFFFAEIQADVSTDSPMTQTLTVTACLILVGGGETTSVCCSCPNVLHPRQGFLKGLYEYDPLSPTSLSFSPTNQWRKTCPDPSFTFSRDEELADELRRVKVALGYYNKKNGTDYELVRIALSNSFTSDGTWFHINFSAKQVVDGKYSHRGFFAEIRADVSTDGHRTQTLTVTACLILEGGGTNFGCSFCLSVAHPHQGFLKGLHKYDPMCSLSPTSPSFQSSLPPPSLLFLPISLA